LHRVIGLQSRRFNDSTARSRFIGAQRFNAQSTMSIPMLIFVYVTVLLGALCGLEIYSEMRRRRFGPTHTEDRIFRCQKCGYVYTDDPDVDRSRCVQCGKLNEPIQF
jgi:rubrerythrin